MPTLANIAKINGIVISGAAAPTDRHILLGTQTASSSATLSFSGLTSHRSDVLRSSFDVLEFRLDNMHPANDNVDFGFQVNATDGADYNDSPITSTVFEARHRPNNTGARSIVYEAGSDQAQGTAYQKMSRVNSNANNASTSGSLRLYSPSSTTYVKHFISETNFLHSAAAAGDRYSINFSVAGYINDTTAIDEISFMFSSGNIDAGEIKMYGIAKA